MRESIKTLEYNPLGLRGTRGGAVPHGHRSRTRSTAAETESKTRAARPVSDRQLVGSCLNGDQNAWNELVTRYQWLIYSVPRRYGLAKADAEDVMQNVFLIVYRRLDTLRDQLRLSAWLIRIAQRETLHYLAQGHNDRELDNTIPTDDVSAQQFQQLETQHAVRQALEQLDPHCRAMLELFLTRENPTYEEVASCLGCPVGSIGPTRARCFKKLEAILRELQVEIAP